MKQLQVDAQRQISLSLDWILNVKLSPGPLSWGKYSPQYLLLKCFWLLNQKTRGGGGGYSPQNRRGLLYLSAHPSQAIGPLAPAAVKSNAQPLFFFASQLLFWHLLGGCSAEKGLSIYQAH